MTTVTVTREIAASPDRVFAAFTDLRNAPARVEGILSLEVLSDGPIGSGTRFRETRKMFGKEATEEMEITFFQPSSSYVVEAESHGAKYRTEFRFEPAAEMTKVTMEFNAQPVTFAAKLMAPLSKLMAKQLEKLCSQDLEDLKTYLEAEQT